MGTSILFIMKRISQLILLAVLPVYVNAGTAPIEAVLAEIKTLREEVSALSERVQSLEKQLDSGMPSGSESGILDRLTDAMHDRRVATHYPWMEQSLWEKIQKGMTPEDVISILGEPSMTDPSLHKRIDTVMTYRGRHPGTGKKVVGKVRYYRGVVADVERPQ